MPIRTTTAERFKAKSLAANLYHCTLILKIFLLSIAGVFVQTTNALSAPTDTLKIPISPGWNMISLPVTVPSGSPSFLFPGAVYPAFAYEGTYVRCDTLRPGVGYWLKFTAPETVTVSGQPFVNHMIDLKKGWNLIGAPAIPIPATALSPTPPNLLISQFFTYSSGGYVVADTLVPGRAYWIKSSQTGMLSEECWQSQPLLSPPDGYENVADPVFIWKKSECAVSYRLQIGHDSLLTTLILDSTLTDTSYQAQLMCDSSTRFWRVGIPTSGQEILWTPSRSYRWGFVERGLLAPADNGGTTLTPRLMWRRTNCPGLYHLQLSKDSSFTTSVVDTALADTVYQCGYLDSAETYYWRVGVSGSWTKTQKFIAAWKYIGLGGETIAALAADWADSNTIYAGSDIRSGHPGSIFKTTNGGATWDTLMRGRNVEDLDIDPFDSRIIYDTEPQMILKTTDGGGSWFRSDSGIVETVEHTFRYMIAIDPQHPDTLYCGTVHYIDPRNLYKSTNGGKFWFSVLTYQSVTAIGIDPFNTQNLYVGFYDAGGVYKTTDGGVTWNNLGFVGYVNDIVVSFTSPQEIYLGGDGFYVSRDSGMIWNEDNVGFQGKHSVVRIVNSVSGNELYCNAGFVYRKSHAGETWENIGIEGVPIEPILLNNDVLYGAYKGIYKFLR